MKINKQKIAEHLRNYVDRFDSQQRAANTLTNVSAATINHMINGKWELIREEMWRHVASQIDYSEDTWQVVDTVNYRLLTDLLQNAQSHSNVLAIVDSAGSGKTQTLKHYAAKNKRAYLLRCSEYWNRKWFLLELLTAMGKDSGGFTVAEMMREVVIVLKAQDRPLIILDEADKLSDQVLYFFITLYNQLEDDCGIMLCATNYLSKRIKRGVANNKKGYTEIYSRMGRKFIQLKGVSSTDITKVCTANGISNRATIKQIIEDSEYDLRRVKRLVHAAQLKENKTQEVLHEESN